MITNVLNAGNGRYIINNSIVIYDLNALDEGIEYSIEYNEKEITLETASEIADEFIKETIYGILELNEK